MNLDREVDGKEDAMLDRALTTLGKKSVVWFACLIFGAGWGVVCGAIAGSVFFPEIGTVYGGTAGGLVGALGGAVAGVTGTVFGGRLGWGLAGVLGGPIITAMLLKHFETSFFGAKLLYVLVPSLVGGALGVAVGRGLRSGKSFVPGVERIVELINDASPPKVTAKPPGLPTELTPAGPPEGRGDEIAPAGTT
jgi:hypothetical protein